MFCKYCGKPVRAGAKFCGGCGKPIAATERPAESVLPQHPEVGDSCGPPVVSPSPSSEAASARSAQEPSKTAENKAMPSFSQTAGGQFAANSTGITKINAKSLVAVIFGIFAVVLVLMILVIGHHGSKSNTTSVPTSAAATSPEDAIHQKLQTAAMEVLHGPNGIGGKVEVGGYSIGCDKVLDEQLTDLEYGTIDAGSAQLPAMKANYLYTCISSIDGERQRKTDFWVVVGMDEEANMYRCVKVAGRPVVDEVANQCGFRGDAAATHANAPNVSTEAPPVTQVVSAEQSAHLPSDSGGLAADAGDASGAGFTSGDELERLAQTGNVEAETELGVQLLTGRGVAKDLAGAAAWFRKAAAARNPRAETNLGWMLTLGQGMRRDDSAALALFSDAAAQTFPNAQDSLGWMYQQGRGVPRDVEIARNWYQKAADQGFAKSVQNLKVLKEKEARSQ